MANVSVSPLTRRFYLDLIETGGVRSIGSWVHPARVLGAQCRAGRLERIDNGTRVRLTRKGWALAKAIAAESSS